MLQVAFAWQVWEVMHSSISTMSGNKTCAFNCVSKRMHFTFFCDITINIHLLLWYYKHYIVLNHKSLSNWTRWFYILIEIITSSGLSVSTHRQFIDTNTERKQKLSICCPEIAVVTSAACDRFEHLRQQIILILVP